MRLVVDLNRCQGYAQCAFLAPDVFTMHGDEALLYNPHADRTQREQVMRAATACPVQAILVDDLGDTADAAEEDGVREGLSGVR
ncbi:ferredoxin [Streptomyces sp. NBC_01217]|uniref:ferredoxin n=1 Tax=Streptomyces sp. NBC_01217 TaxID=2903779 RepID=UPI002E116773|nr:ferredoxin [Streptomyces sp. NBC_01217]